MVYYKSEALTRKTGVYYSIINAMLYYYLGGYKSHQFLRKILINTEN